MSLPSGVPRAQLDGGGDQDRKHHGVIGEIDRGATGDREREPDDEAEDREADGTLAAPSGLAPGPENSAAAPASRTTQITASATPAGRCRWPLSNAPVRCSVEAAASVAASASSPRRWCACDVWWTWRPRYGHRPAGETPGGGKSGIPRPGDGIPRRGIPTTICPGTLGFPVQATISRRTLGARSVSQALLDSALAAVAFGATLGSCPRRQLATRDSMGSGWCSPRFLAAAAAMAALPARGVRCHGRRQRGAMALGYAARPAGRSDDRPVPARRRAGRRAPVDGPHHRDRRGPVRVHFGAVRDRTRLGLGVELAIGRAGLGGRLVRRRA